MSLERILATTIVAAAVLVASTIPTRADTIHVPGDYPEVYEAVNASSTGDTVLVAPGTYVSFDYPTRIRITHGISLLSEEGPEVTTIAWDVNHSGYGGVPVISINNAEEVKIEGFTITGGYNYMVPGGGISCGNSDVDIQNNIIVNNSGDIGAGICLSGSSGNVSNNIIFGNIRPYGSIDCKGGGIASYFSDVSITDNIIEGCASDKGGGIYIQGGNVDLESNIITSNNASIGGGLYLDDPVVSVTGNLIEGNYSNNKAGGIYCIDCDSGLIIDHNTITDNRGTYGGSIYLYNSSPNISSNILHQNNSILGGEIDCWGSSSPDIIYNDFWSNEEHGSCTLGEGNIFEDPLFCGFEPYEFHIQDCSPCLGAGEDGTDIGAFGEGCECTTPVEAVSWGAIKAAYRE